MNFEGVERTFAQRSETGIRLYAHVAIEQIVGILATPEVFILAARGKAVEARDARLQSVGIDAELRRSAENTSELPSLMRISYAVIFLNKQNKTYLQTLSQTRSLT